MLNTKVIEQPQRGARKPPKLGVMPLGLELGDDHDRHDDLVLVESHQRVRIGKQDAGVDDESTAAVVRTAAGCSHVCAPPHGAHRTPRVSLASRTGTGPRGPVPAPPLDACCDEALLGPPGRLDRLPCRHGDRTSAFVMIRVRHAERTFARA